MTNHAYKPKRILWLDMEMTGLDPVHDWPLEVAMIVTDWDMKELATWEGVIHYEPSELAAKLDENREFWDENIDARKGLEEQNEHGVSREEFEASILAFLDEHFDEGKILLGGNSIHQDRRFITQWLPKFDARLHYRMLDVSAWKVVFEGKFGKKFAKPEEHRALEDIRGSIMELKYYVAKVRTS